MGYASKYYEAKYNIVPGIGFWNRKRTLVEKLVKSEWTLTLINSYISVLIIHFDKCTLVM